MRAHFRRCERPRAHDLMHFPLEQIEGAKARRRVRIAGGDFLRFVFGSGADDVDAVLPVRGRTGEKNFT